MKLSEGIIEAICQFKILPNMHWLFIGRQSSHHGLVTRSESSCWRAQLEIARSKDGAILDFSTLLCI